MTTVDLTNSSWGRNISVSKWNPEEGTGKAAVWLTPAPKVGDIFIIPSQLGTMKVEVTKSEKASWTVDDMFWVWLKRYEESDDSVVSDLR